MLKITVTTGQNQELEPAVLFFIDNTELPVPYLHYISLYFTIKKGLCLKNAGLRKQPENGMVGAWGKHGNCLNHRRIHAGGINGTITIYNIKLKNE
jgi:hypothetical protein